MALAAKYTLRFARINATADGDNTIVAAPSDTTKSIYVIGYSINTNAAGVVGFQDSAASAVIFATWEFADGGGAAFAGNLDCPAFKVTTGLGLEVNVAAGVDALGHVTYILA
jgi:hypothetical protein